MKPPRKRKSTKVHPDPRSTGKEPNPVACPWMQIEPPAERSLKVYALDPSASQAEYVGNCMTARVKWEDLEPGPVGRKIAVVDYDAANDLYYPPVDLNDPRILARGGLDPTESDPRFHQQMVYAVASETIDRFEAALGRKIHWRRADRPPVADDASKEKLWNKRDDIWRLNLFPHAMIQANAFYSPEAKGILFGYFTAAEKNQGDNLPGQRVFTCLSHDIIAHEVTHAIVDGIRTYFTEPTNPDVLAFHEAFADLTALFAHFSHKEALIDVIHKTGGLLYRSIIKPEASPDGSPPLILAETSTRNSFIDLAKQFGQATGMGRGLRSALGDRTSPDSINIEVNDVHSRGAILVAAVFDAYFTTYIRRTAKLMRVFRAGGGNTDSDLPAGLDELLAEQATSIASEFFTLCVRALDYCPPVDLTYGDFLRALITVHLDETEEEGREVREVLMRAFKQRGIYADTAFFSQDSLCWPRERWIGGADDAHLNPATALPPLFPKTIVDRGTGQARDLRPVFGSTSGMTRDEKNINGDYFRQYAADNAGRLGFDDDPALPPERRPYAPSFHSMFRMQNGALKTFMVVELVQSRTMPFDPKMPSAGSFPFRAGVTLIIAAPDVDSWGRLREAEVRYAIRKTMKSERAERQRDYHLAMGLADGDVDDPHHFQANFGLIHQGF